MKNNKNLILWGVAILIGAGLLVGYGYFVRSKSNNPDLVLPTNQVTPTETLIPSPETTPRPSVPVPSTPTPEPFLGLNGVKSPATCQVGGEVKFTSSDSFLSLDSKISWQNIDSRGRLIKWHISPDDQLAVGPNIFESLPLPDGQYQNLTVRLPENPISKNYLLTASVTYGQFVKGNLEVKETNCIGQVKVNLNF
ncbi:MAG: hypothetical protein Q8Q89_01080 [bacterium]|nr:hypothetical protein [bacterium]